MGTRKRGWVAVLALWISVALAQALPPAELISWTITPDPSHLAACTQPPFYDVGYSNSPEGPFPTYIITSATSVANVPAPYSPTFYSVTMRCVGGGVLGLFAIKFTG